MHSSYSRSSENSLTNLKQFLMIDKFRFDAHYKSSIRHNIKLNDFKIESLIGKGSYGRIYLVKEKRSDTYYALKKQSKRKIYEAKQVENAWHEKRILQATNFPFIIRLFYYFHDTRYIYFVLQFVIGGDLFHLMKKKQKFDEDMSRFYAAQLVLALEYLHYMNVVYRDLKLENILVDENGYLKIVDLGFSKLIKDRTYTLCGTPEYLAPEIILNKGYGTSVDWWAFGVIIYEMNNGTPPFQHWDHVVLYEKILEGNYMIPAEFSENLKDIVSHLIEVNLTKRYGNLKNGVDDIKSHKWFKCIVWLEILNKLTDPPYKPVVNGPADLSNFDIPTDDIEEEEKEMKVKYDKYAVNFNNF